MLTPTMKEKIDALVRTVYNNKNMINPLDWFLEGECDCKNIEDLAVGYFFGSFLQIAQAIVEHEKYIENFEKRVKNVDKILVSKKILRNNRKVITEVTGHENKQIKRILKDWMPRFREKIRTEITLLKG